MSVSTALIALLGRKLFQEYSKATTIREIGDMLLGSDEIANGLVKLIEEGRIKLGKATEESDFHAALLGKIIDQLKALQVSSGTLKPDGVFGAATKKWLENRPFGHHPPRQLDSVAGTNVAPGASNVLRWHVVSGHLAKLRGLTPDKALKRLKEAWGSWQDVCNIDPKQDGQAARSSVIINVKVLGGAASTLAIADVGPPKDRQLELTFDEAEIWTEDKFQATAAHEMGHLLGIKHEDVVKSGQLMNETLHAAIMLPQGSKTQPGTDIFVARKLWP